MESYSDSDTSSESGCGSDFQPDNESDNDDDLIEYQPERSMPTDDDAYKTYWKPIDQLEAQIESACLNQLHKDIKARATILDLAYQKLPRMWPPRPFDIRTLPNLVQDPIHYFELFWTPEVFAILVENTNKYAQFKEARHKENPTKKSRWWKAVDLYEMRVFIALLIYISIDRNSNIQSYWSNSLTIHKPMEHMKFYRFEQIKRYFHVSPPSLPSQSKSQWYMKLSPLFEVLRYQFQAYVIPGQNVSFDEMMVPFTGRSQHTLRIKNKPISEGFKIWALCDHGYTWDFLWYSRVSSK
jgi:hypothetical protein